MITQYFIKKDKLIYYFEFLIDNNNFECIEQKSERSSEYRHFNIFIFQKNVIAF